MKLHIFINNHLDHDVALYKMTRLSDLGLSKNNHTCTSHLHVERFCVNSSHHSMKQKRNLVKSQPHTTVHYAQPNYYVHYCGFSKNANELSFFFFFFFFFFLFWFPCDDQLVCSCCPYLYFGSPITVYYMSDISE